MIWATCTILGLNSFTFAALAYAMWVNAGTLRLQGHPTGARVAVAISMVLLLVAVALLALLVVVAVAS